jgi:hypothetical protein
MAQVTRLFNADGQPVEAVVEHDLAGKAARAGHACGKIEHVFLVIAGARKPGKICRIDNDMAGRTGHLPLARSLQRLITVLRKVEQDRARGCLCLGHPGAVGADESDADHAAIFPWASAAATMRWSASASSASLV